MRVYGAIVCLAAMIAPGVVATADHHSIADADITAQHVRGPIHMLMGHGGNIAVSTGEDGLLIVDDEWKPLTGKVQAALKDIRDEPVAIVLNTHHHADHTGGNAAFGKHAVIVAHDNVRKHVMRQQRKTPEAWPELTFPESISIHFNGEEIRMLHFPHGHTDGDSIVIFTESNVLHMGDLLFTDSFPSFYTNEGGDIEGYVRNVGAILELIGTDTIVIAGHGRIAARGDVEAYYAMMSETVDIVRGYVARGLSREEARAEGLPEQYHRWANDFTSIETWIAKVYASLTD